MTYFVTFCVGWDVKLTHIMLVDCLRRRRRASWLTWQTDAARWLPTRGPAGVVNQLTSVLISVRLIQLSRRWLATSVTLLQPVKVSTLYLHIVGICTSCSLLPISIPVYLNTYTYLRFLGYAVLAGSLAVFLHLFRKRTFRYKFQRFLYGPVVLHVTQRRCQNSESQSTDSEHWPDIIRSSATIWLRRIAPFMPVSREGLLQINYPPGVEFVHVKTSPPLWRTYRPLHLFSFFATPFHSTRIVSLLFQAGCRKRRLNSALVFCIAFALYVYFS